MSDQSDKSPQTRIDDCWNQIGVRGDGSCPKLVEHVHCRNCPVYSAAAIQLLNGDLPTDQTEDWTQHYATELRQEDTVTESAVVFRVGPEWFALATVNFKEVVPPRKTHPLPHRRNQIVLGLVNVRGSLLVSVSLLQLLGLSGIGGAQDKGDRLRHPQLLVVSWEGRSLVFPVDEVLGVHRYQRSQLKDVPSTVAKATATYTKSMLLWREKSIGLLDDQLLFYSINRNLA